MSIDPDNLAALPDDRTAVLDRCRPWLQVLARMEIDSRFNGKFSASDVVQQTIFEAWRDWQRFEGDDPRQRMAWLRRILANRLAQAARQYGGTHKRDVGREVSLEHSLAQSSQRLGDLLAGGGPSPSQEAVRHEEQLRLAAVLERLPDDYRQVIVLRNLEELPHEEVARRMGRSPGAVRMLWVRALAELKRLIEQG
jgi:RNA polymerase sigma-70 factor (ECF subfamily)